jgi:hypothetical protein
MSNRKLKVMSSRSFPPLALWRSIPAPELKMRDVGRLRDAMYGVQILGEPEWRAAVEGDPAEAVGIAIRVAAKEQLNGLVVDLVMSAVLATAIEGDHAACHLLAHILNRRSAVEPHAGNLATSWTLASRNNASVRRGHKQSPGMRPPRRHGVAS